MGTIWKWCCKVFIFAHMGITLGVRNVSNLLRHLSREISVVHRSYVNICHLIAVHNDRLAMVLATLYMEPLGPCFHEANGDATAALVASLPR